MSDKPTPYTTAQRRARWELFVPGETVLEFGRPAVGVGPNGAKLLPVQQLAEYRARYYFVVPPIPDELKERSRAK